MANYGLRWWRDKQMSYYSSYQRCCCSYNWQVYSSEILTMVTSSMGAPWCSSNAAQSTWSPCAAMCRGLRPFFVLAVSWASWLINIWTTALWPLRPAQCSGVKPSCSHHYFTLCQSPVHTHWFADRHVDRQSGGCEQGFTVAFWS